MCGIAGILNVTPAVSGPIPEQALDAMVSALAHRGPDGEGAVCPDPRLQLGHRRLAIIDLSLAAGQPMTDPQHGHVLAFNGEIYNYQDLRHVLEGLGHTFQTKSDSEVVLKAYAQWQLDFARRLRGIFAIALWDAFRRCLVLARDHLGVKPLYYAFADGRLVFASEVRAILASGLVRRELDPAGLDAYLAYGSVQEPFTLVRGIRSLPAASLLCTRLQQPGATTPFWTPNLTTPTHPPEDRQARTAELLKEAVALQMTADVKIGAFLSGGIDSAAVVALMRQATTADIHTFTIAFTDQRLDERRQAAAMAARCQTIHTELEISAEDLRRRLPDALLHYDQPSIDGLNTWLVAGLTRETGLKTVLSGVGGDELFVGYDGFARPRRLLRLEQRLRDHPALRRLLRLAARLLDREDLHKVAGLTACPLSPYFYTRQIFSETTRLALAPRRETTLVKDWYTIAFGALDEAAGAYGRDDINRISFLELNTYLRSTLLRDTDQAGMAHGLEIRVPLLDHRVVEHLLRLPGPAKIAPDCQKPLLIAAAGLPPALGQQPKRGFVLPFEQLLRDLWQAELADTFNQPHPLFVTSAMQKLWKGYQAGRVPWPRLWAVFNLIHWLKRHQIV